MRQIDRTEREDLTKGFTLIELLVVIAIVAILAVVVVLTLNPAELLKQARDSNRINDLNTVKSALSQYLADGGLTLATNYANCYMSATSSSPANCGFAGTYTAVSSTSRAADGTGWVPVNFNTISSGAPFGALPIDPTNASPYVYRYVASSTNLTFKLMVSLESAKYTTGSASSTPANDGGTSSTAYEVGAALGL